GRAQEHLLAQHVLRYLGWLHVSDRAPFRYRPGYHPYQGRASVRWQPLPDRHQDLHHWAWARPERKHHSTGAGETTGRAWLQPRYLPVPGAEVYGQCRWHGGRAQQGELWFHRAQDGDQGLRHLRDELRWCQGLVGRRTQPRPELHVHHDEL